MMLLKISRIIIIAIILSVSLISVSAPAYGQDPIDLVLGGAGSTPWDIQQIKPGDSGTKVVELHNDGSSDGQLTIWVDDILSTEGTNPESETGNTAEPGELINYILLGCAADGLDTNMALPVTIDNLPDSADDTDYLRLPLDASQTITLTWEWEFTETGQSQNDAQGDGISFSIYYYLEETGGDNPPAAVPHVSYNDPPHYQHLDVVVLGEENSVNIDDWGRLVQTETISDPDNATQLVLERGTRITGTSGEEITKLEMRAVTDPAPPADGSRIIGRAYEIFGYTGDNTATWVTFDRPALLTIGYDPGLLPEDVGAVYVGVLDGNGSWRRYEGHFVSNEPNTLSTIIFHSSVFAVIAVLDIRNEVAADYLPAHPGDSTPLQSVGTSPDVNAAIKPHHHGVTSFTLYPPPPPEPTFVLPGDIVESWKQVSLLVILIGSVALVIMGYFERRRHTPRYYMKA